MKQSSEDGTTTFIPQCPVCGQFLQFKPTSKPKTDFTFDNEGRIYLSAAKLWLHYPDLFDDKGVE